MNTWKNTQHHSILDISKSTMRYHFTPVRMVIQKIYKKSGEHVEKRETSGAVCDIVNWYSHYGEHYRESFKT